MKKQIILGATAAIVIMTRTALGNDSSAELAAGGLVFTKNLNVEMQSEDLYLSAKEVRVRYRFFNKSDSDVVTTVAFAMPDIPLDENGNIVEGFSDAVQFPNDDQLPWLQCVAETCGKEGNTKKKTAS